MLGRGLCMREKLQKEEKLPPLGRATISRHSLLRKSALGGPPPLIPARSSAGPPVPSCASSAPELHARTADPPQRSTCTPPPPSTPASQPPPEAMSDCESTAGSIASETPMETSDFSAERLASMEDLPDRPSFSKAGQQIEVLTNFIRVKFPESSVYQYHVEFDPPVDSIFLRQKLLEPHLQKLARAWRFDGCILFSSSKFPHNSATLEGLDERSGEVIKFHYELTHTVALQDCTPLLNMIFRAVLSKLKYTRLGKEQYDPSRKTTLEKHKLELWPGYVTSVERKDGGFMLQTNVSHKMLRTDTVMDMLLDLYRTQPNNVHNAARKEILGQIVMTRYNNKTYRVDDIDWNMSPSSTFEDRRKNRMSFLQYYREAYGIQIRDPDQPLLVHRSKPKRNLHGPSMEEATIYLVPELCAMTGLSSSIKSDYTAKKDIASHTRLDPRERVRALKEFISNVQESEGARGELEKWNITIEEETLRVEARQLNQERLIFGAQRDISTQMNERGEFSIEAPPILPRNIDNWIVIFVRRDERKIREFVQTMVELGKKLRVKIGAPAILPIPNDRTESYIEMIDRYLTDDVQMVVTVVPSERDDRYSAIKQLCYQRRPVAQQVIRTATLSQPSSLKAKCVSLACQMINKLGGALWTVNIPLKNAMVVGIDAYHDPSTRGFNSAIALVASLDRAYSQFYSDSRTEGKGAEFSGHLQHLMTTALRHYKMRNGYLPERIIVFRDGLSEGQFPLVKQYEVSQFEKACAAMEGDYLPQLIVVVVQKRIRTRLFHSEGSEIGNALPGTVLDHTVTSDHLYDFFLVSQHVNKGTAAPTHYIVVHDTTTLKPEHVQQLAYKLTHMYYNWAGTVRVPSVCLYAHKLAYMHGQHLHAPAAPELKDKLFYL